MIKDEKYIDLFQDKYLGYLKASNGKSIIYFSKIIEKGNRTGIALGKLDSGEEMVIKCYFKENRNTLTEINYYEKISKDINLHNINHPFPKFYGDFKLGKCPVLVLEKLEHLDKEDNPCDVGIAVLNMLKHIHKITIHNGIKPDNIMKRKDGTYFLIDYGGVAEEKCEYGYIRRTWSPLWTCQEKGKSNQITTPKHDFLELAKTLKYLDKKYDHHDERIQKFSENTKLICKKCSGKPKNYDYLISILRD